MLKKEWKIKTSIIPPFPQRLESKKTDPTTDALLEEVNNLCVKIPLL